MTGMGKYQDFVASHSNEEYLMEMDHSPINQNFNLNKSGQNSFIA